MPIIDLSNPRNILIAVILFVLITYLAKETKRSSVTCILLLAFLTIIGGHCIEYGIVNDATGATQLILTKCIAIDFVFVFLSFMSYLWTDDIEAKHRNLKSVDNSLDWFWKKV